MPPFGGNFGGLVGFSINLEYMRGESKGVIGNMIILTPRNSFQDRIRTGGQIRPTVFKGSDLKVVEPVSSVPI